MEMHQETSKNLGEPLLQWHPALFAGLQIEFGAEAKYLQFEQEHQLGTKPMSIDILIKKENNQSIHKNIGRIFRKYNIIEYKGPGDYLSIDDFYKVYGYTCFYKSDSVKTNEIKAGELTISFISEGYPRTMIEHLQQERYYQITKVDEGIYYVSGDKIPIQIIVTGQLSGKNNLWLRNLTNRIQREQVKKLLEDYRYHERNPLYRSVMNLIVRANKKEFQEVKGMCEALVELMQDELEESKQIGIKIGEQQGENRVNDLILRLSQSGREADIVKAAADKEFQNRLFREFGI